jgi:hypothetical protein
VKTDESGGPEKIWLQSYLRQSGGYLLPQTKVKKIFDQGTGLT